MKKSKLVHFKKLHSRVKKHLNRKNNQNKNSLKKKTLPQKRRLKQFTGEIRLKKLHRVINLQLKSLMK